MVKYLVGLFLAVLLGVGIGTGIYQYKKKTNAQAASNQGTERTCAIIKPDAVEKKHAGEIISLIEKAGFSLAAMKKLQLSADEAEAFYAVHAQRPFFKDLITFMTRGPVIVMALEKKNAVADWRQLMGSTNPAQAPEGSIRKLYGTDVQQNAVHGSDSLENAEKEIAFFFPSPE